jgi:4-amino-4-deoxy-L-arabinose transferase-like glycosyltransferase
VIPAYFIYGLIITPDTPLIWFWLLTMYLVSIAPWIETEFCIE